MKCPNVDSEAFVALGTHCTALENLTLSDCPNVTDQALKAIATHNKSICKLYVSGTTQITDEGIGALVLARKDVMKRIALTEGVTDRSIRLVVENCPRLKWLDLFSSLLTDEGCHPIMQLRYIKGLTIHEHTKGNRPVPLPGFGQFNRFGPVVSLTMALTMIRALKASLKQILIDNMPEQTWSKREDAIRPAVKLAPPGVKVLHW